MCRLALAFFEFLFEFKIPGRNSHSSRNPAFQSSVVERQKMLTFRVFALFSFLTEPLINAATPKLRNIAPVKPDVPVYSLSTLNEDRVTTNLNIITYATQVGIKPNPVWAISLYKKTLSHDNFIRSCWGVLQLLPPGTQDLVPLLGKQSGRDVNKVEIMAATMGIQLSELHIHAKTGQLVEDSVQEYRGGVKSMGESSDVARVPVITKSPLLLLVKYRKELYPPMDVGDHEVFMCDIERTFVIDSGSINCEQYTSEPSGFPDYLSTQTLRKMKII
jgi:flavin reductase (DIM6/NTAB) family NADH-FMN oxidoreductase RutF